MSLSHDLTLTFIRPGLTGSAGPAPGTRATDITVAGNGIPNMKNWSSSDQAFPPPTLSRGVLVPARALEKISWLCASDDKKG